MALRHAFNSAVADGGDATLVRPSNWNAAHVGVLETEVDFGTALYQRAKSFTVTDADVSTSSRIVVYQALTAATGKQQDENEMDALSCRAVPGTGQFTVYVESLTGSVAGKFKLHYLAA